MKRPGEGGAGFPGVDRASFAAQHPGMPKKMRNWTQTSFARLNALVWCVFTLLFFVRANLHIDTQPAMLLSAFQLTVCIIFSSVLHFCYERLGIAIGFHVRTCAWVLGLSLLATFVQSTLAQLFIDAMGWGPLSSSLLDVWLLRTMFFWLLYIAWSLIYFWLRAEREAQERARRVVEAQASAQRLELQLLRSQLDPHFLFNALNGIATTIPTQPGIATAMVRELADYLRYTLDHRQDSITPLAAEFECVQAYLKIEEARFGDHLRVEIAADGVASQRQVPCFLLQPLVENAIKHSFENTPPPWRLQIEAIGHGGHLELAVRNSGVLREQKLGVGLETLRRRLELHYPGRHTFVLRQEGEMVCAALRLEGEPCLE